MAAKEDSEGFVSSPLDGQGARHKDSYLTMSDENIAELRDTDAEFRRLKADFLRIARNRRRRDLSRSESSRSPLPVSANIKHPHILGIPDKSKSHVTVWACAESVYAAEVTQRCLEQSTTLTYYLL